MPDWAWWLVDIGVLLFVVAVNRMAEPTDKMMRVYKIVVVYKNVDRK